jgi:electron transport complex protein RnfD
MQKLWLICLLPAFIASLYLFGLQALRIVTFTVAFSLIFDFICSRIVPSKDETINLSVATHAILLAFLLPYTSPWWLILTGSFIMVVLGRRLFGGEGGYPVHPVLLSFGIMLVSWPKFFDYAWALISRDLGIKMIEPFRMIKTAGTQAEAMFHYKDLLLGYQVAGIGNGLVIYLLAGGLLLLVLRQIKWHIPVSFLAGTYISAGTLHLIDPELYANPVFFILSGSVVFAAFFLATDHTTSPVNGLPMLLYGFLGGVLLVIIRTFSVYSDGAVFAILLINLCNPLLDRLTPAIGMKRK